MGRIRTIKPEFHAHEELSALPPETHLLASALVNYADDEGYFNAHPVLVKAGTNPLRKDATSIEDQLASLENIGYIVIVRCEGKCFGRITTFSSHQKVSHAVPSKIKPKFESLQPYLPSASESLPKSSGEVPEILRPELNGIELNRREGGSQVITPDMIARGVLTECGLSGRELVTVLEEVCRSQVKLYESPGALRDAMVDSWRQYDVSKPSLAYTKGAAKFFGDGDWRNMEGWPWKPGTRANEVKPMTAAEKMRRVQ